jgi:hypothetical protein
MRKRSSYVKPRPPDPWVERLVRLSSWRIGEDLAADPPRRAWIAAVLVWPNAA